MLIDLGGRFLVWRASPFTIEEGSGGLSIPGFIRAARFLQTNEIA